MAANCCPTCNRPYPKPRTAAVTTAAVDTAALNDAELLAYYRKIGARENCRFFLQHAIGMPAAVHAEASALLAELQVRASKPADVKRLNVLKDAARAARPWICGCPLHKHTHLTAALVCQQYGPDDGTPEYLAVREEVLQAAGF